MTETTEPIVGSGRPSPYVCLVCKYRKSAYYGRLVWENEIGIPTCPNHKVPQPLTPA